MQSRQELVRAPWPARLALELASFIAREQGYTDAPRIRTSNHLQSEENIRAIQRPRKAAVTLVPPSCARRTAASCWAPALVCRRPCRHTWRLSWDSSSSSMGLRPAAHVATCFLRSATWMCVCAGGPCAGCVACPVGGPQSRRNAVRRAQHVMQCVCSIRQRCQAAALNTAQRVHGAHHCTRWASMRKPRHARPLSPVIKRSCTCEAKAFRRRRI